MVALTSCCVACPFQLKSEFLGVALQPLVQFYDFALSANVAVVLCLNPLETSSEFGSLSAVPFNAVNELDLVFQFRCE